MSGLKGRTIEVDGQTVAYAERIPAVPSTSTLLFLHGFSSEKYSCNPLVLQIPVECPVHVIALDLPGHGGSFKPEWGAAPMVDMATSVVKFIQTKELQAKPLHMVGISMGGEVAAIFAGLHPEYLAALTLIASPVGFQTPTLSRYYVYRDIEDKNYWFPENIEDARIMLDLCYFHKPEISDKVLEEMIRIKKPSYQYYRQLYDLRMKDKHETMLNLLKDITAPVQLLWGENDDVVDISGIDVLRHHIPDVRRVDVLPECGHSIYNDASKPGAECLLEFHSNICNVK